MITDQKITDSINKLGVAQKKLLEKIIDSFESGVETTVNPKSDLCKNPAFADYFANLFSVYHTITEHKFEKKSSEFAFKYAFLACGIPAEVTENSSHQGEDVICGGVKYSLKTEGEKHQDITKISKFSEAAFMSKYVTYNEQKLIDELSDDDPEKSGKSKLLDDRRQKILLPKLVSEFQETIGHHLNSYDRMVTLKGIAIKDGDKIVSYRYRLIEIPMDSLRGILSLEVDDFKPLRANAGTSANVIIDGKKVLGVTLDGSDQKLTITGIAIEHCITHAEFIVPISV